MPHARRPHACSAPSTVIGIVSDSRVWRHAIVVLQQLRDVQTTLPAVVFNTTELATAYVSSIEALGGTLVSLEPTMPVHESMIAPLGRSHGGQPAWRKLGLWAQVQYAKIIYLDIDVLIMRNIDHMARFPADAFTPEVCSFPKCEPDRIPAGINVGVMVIAPAQWKFEALQRYAIATAAKLEATSAAEETRALGLRYLGSAEQSFLREFYEDVMNASLVDPLEVRRGWDWEVQSYRDSGACARRERREKGSAGGCVAGTTNVMSRRYNARPLDCARCPATIDNIIVHYACTIKPWERSRPHWRRMSWCDRRDNRSVGNPMWCMPPAHPAIHALTHAHLH